MMIAHVFLAAVMSSSAAIEPGDEKSETEEVNPWIAARIERAEREAGNPYVDGWAWNGRLPGGSMANIPPSCFELVRARWFWRRVDYNPKSAHGGSKKVTHGLSYICGWPDVWPEGFILELRSGWDADGRKLIDFAGLEVKYAESVSSFYLEERFVSEFSMPLNDFRFIGCLVEDGDYWAFVVTAIDEHNGRVSYVFDTNGRLVRELCSAFEPVLIWRDTSSDVAWLESRTSPSGPNRSMTAWMLWTDARQPRVIDSQRNWPSDDVPDIELRIRKALSGLHHPPVQRRRWLDQGAVEALQKRARQVLDSYRGINEEFHQDPSRLPEGEKHLSILEALRSTDHPRRIEALASISNLRHGTRHLIPDFINIIENGPARRDALVALWRIAKNVPDVAPVLASLLTKADQLEIPTRGEAYFVFESLQAVLTDWGKCRQDDILIREALPYL
ncbi:MAG: hypothetical protein GY906_15475 [bacterium]|nr:hypothetical protein [bacterium]